MTEKNEQPDSICLQNTTQIRVRFNETDALRIVWHGNYLRYFEDGREAFGREHGISYLDFQRNHLAIPIVKSTCEHKLPLRYGELLTIKTIYVDSAAAKLVFRYELFNQQNKIVCTGETVQVFMTLDGDLQLTIPDFILDWKLKMGLI
ncbi:acyl-CoA thioesterase [Vaginella massiliensis]|uniref:acyl-CoA thioesterase n=1 Tax=Vaginella massiliensis TaxID=1816680 RepID=UPI0037516BDD